jgi:signal peptidase I
VRVEDVVGKVFALVWPRDHFQRITRPDIFEDIPDPK